MCKISGKRPFLELYIFVWRASSLMT